MKLWDKIAKKFASKAGDAVKCEVKKTAIDLLPAVFGLVAAVVGVVIFKEAVEDSQPTYTATRIVTNNYFLGDSGEDIIKKIIDKEDFE